MDKIVKYKKSPLQKLADRVLTENELEIKIGDQFMNNRGDVLTVEKFVRDFYMEDNDGNGQELKKPRKVETIEIRCWYEYLGNVQQEDGTIEVETCKSYHNYSLREFKNDLVKLEKPIEEYEKQAMAIITGAEPMPEVPKSGEATGTELVFAGGKDTLIAIQSGMIKKKNEAQILYRTIESIIKSKTQNLYSMVSEMEKQIAKVSKVIHTLELYIGINEDVVQIAFGKPADVKEPICIRQQMLYMDEEVADIENGGIDITKIEQFDKWLSKNYKICIPEEKCIVVFRVRRNEKDYGDPWYTAQMKIANEKTYFCIRNGTNVYRIWANIRVNTRLFPKKEELNSLLKEYETTHSNSDKERMESKFFKYKQQGIILQGLLDRTEILHPLPAEHIKLADDQCVIDGFVRFIGDDELCLPDGHLEFWNWHKKINKNVGVGSRILWVSELGGRRKNGGDRFFRYYNEHNIPPMPRTDIFTLEELKVSETDYKIERIFNTHKDWIKITSGKSKKYRVTRTPWNDPDDFTNPKYCEDGDTSHINTPDHKKYKWVECNVFSKSGSYEMETKIVPYLILKYNPKDTVYSGWGYYSNERKNRLSFKVEPDERALFNYDQIDLRDIEYYLHSRINRHLYLDMMPVLLQMREHRLKEIEQEKDFVRLVIGQLLNYNIADIDSKVWQAVDWWKHKNKWKRPIAKDDTLALRMISKKILRGI